MNRKLLGGTARKYCHEGEVTPSWNVQLFYILDKILGKVELFAPGSVYT